MGDVWAYLPIYLVRRIFFSSQEKFSYFKLVLKSPQIWVLPIPCMHSTKLYSPALLRVSTLYLCSFRSYLLIRVEADNMDST